VGTEIAGSRDTVRERNHYELIPNALRALVAVAAAYYILTFVIIALFRIGHPFELEWMEGGTVDHVRRVLTGERIYGSPSLDFMPYVYPPLYYYVAAAASQLIGVGFLPLRLVSLISSLACLTYLFLIVKRETGRACAGVLSVGFFAATYRISGAWFDIGRNDTLCLFFALVGIHLVSFRRTRWHDTIAGCLFALAFLTKQTATVILVPVLAFLAVTRPIRLVSVLGSFAVIIIPSLLILQASTEGWFAYWVFEMPRAFSIRILDEMIGGFWTQDIVSKVGIVLMLAIVFMLVRSGHSARKRLFYGLIAVGMIGGSWLPRIQFGGFHNTLIPAYLILSLMAGLGLSAVLDMTAKLNHSGRAFARTGLYLVIFVQFLILHYDPYSQVPTNADVTFGRTVVRRLSTLEGDVFVPYHGFLSKLAGKRTFAHQMPISDVLTCGTEKTTSILEDELKAALSSRRFSAIVLDQDSWFFEELIESNYVKSEAFTADETTGRPVTGWRVRPKWLLVPRVRQTPIG
jgi:hypothetical protein